MNDTCIWEPGQMPDYDQVIVMFIGKWMVYSGFDVALDFFCRSGPFLFIWIMRICGDRRGGFNLPGRVPEYARPRCRFPYFRPMGLLNPNLRLKRVRSLIQYKCVRVGPLQPSLRHSLTGVEIRRETCPAWAWFYRLQIEQCVFISYHVYGSWDWEFEMIGFSKHCSVRF